MEGFAKISTDIKWFYNKVCNGECERKLFQWTITPVQSKGKIIFIICPTHFLWRKETKTHGVKNISEHFFFTFCYCPLRLKQRKKKQMLRPLTLFLYNSQHKVWNVEQFLLEHSCGFVLKQGIMRSRNAACIEKVGQNIYQTIFYMWLLTVNHITLVISYFEGKSAMSGFYLWRASWIWLAYLTSQ